METTEELFRAGGGSITPRGRRRWPERLKARIVAETREPGAKVQDVAERYGANPKAVSQWRCMARDGLLGLPPAEPIDFAQVALCDGARPASPPRGADGGAAPVEIVFGSVSIRMDGAAPAARIAEIARALGAAS